MPFNLLSRKKWLIALALLVSLLGLINLFSERVSKKGMTKWEKKISAKKSAYDRGAARAAQHASVSSQYQQLKTNMPLLFSSKDWPTLLNRFELLAEGHHIQIESLRPGTVDDLEQKASQLSFDVSFQAEPKAVSLFLAALERPEEGFEVTRLNCEASAEAGSKIRCSAYISSLNLS